MQQDSFSRVLISAVDESLSALGDSSKQALFLHLESAFKITKESIPTNLTGFSRALEGIFGPGASHLEKLIAKHLRERLGLPPEDMERSSFPECIDHLRKRAKPEHGRAAR